MQKRQNAKMGGLLQVFSYQIVSLPVTERLQVTAKDENNLNFRNIALIVIVLHTRERLYMG